MKLSTALLLLTLSTLSLAAPAPAPAPAAAPAPAPEPLRKERPWPYRYYWGYYPGKRSLPPSTNSEAEVAKRNIPSITLDLPKKPDLFPISIPVPTAIPTPTSVVTLDPDLFKKPIVVPSPALTWGLRPVPEGENPENSFVANAEVEIAK
ncbi:hypothetical protein BKA64DRAFT_712823 [Cadophora sp. MPI-SDFR-AT-0126]|nr:hypothetical protein BKA64DRAFT_712823 [Leotiomycetes sp. MPI-SDFR-AT-0126]